MISVICHCYVRRVKLKHQNVNRFDLNSLGLIVGSELWKNRRYYQIKLVEMELTNVKNY